MALYHRFDARFLDTLLILVWISIGGLLLVGLIFTLAPGIQQLAHDTVKAETAFMATAYTFVILSTLRYVQHWEHSPFLLPIAYVLCQVATSLLVTSTIVKRPHNLLLGMVAPACIVTLLLIPLIRIWDKIKPLETRRTVPIARIRRQQKEAQEEKNSIKDSVSISS